MMVVMEWLVEMNYQDLQEHLDEIDCMGMVLSAKEQTTYDGGGHSVLT